MKQLSRGARNAQLAARARRLVDGDVPITTENANAFSTAWAETAAYARRLADAGGDLIYEEMFKLLSLADDLESLVKAGAAVDTAVAKLVRQAVDKRISKQRRMATLVAEDLVKDRNAKAWPFSTLLRGR
jgi:hypothetical protein